jgi:NADP-dependent 3-hydroxy acid dehydrogenase YdfG
MENLFDIQGNITVITGGTGVLGRTIAKYLTQQGAKVVLLARKEEKGKAIAQEICDAGG